MYFNSIQFKIIIFLYIKVYSDLFCFVLSYLNKNMSKTLSIIISGLNFFLYHGHGTANTESNSFQFKSIPFNPNQFQSIQFNDCLLNFLLFFFYVSKLCQYLNYFRSNFLSPPWYLVIRAKCSSF